MSTVERVGECNLYQGTMKNSAKRNVMPAITQLFVDSHASSLPGKERSHYTGEGGNSDYH